jgi:hypothetical protein
MSDDKLVKHQELAGITHWSFSSASQPNSKWVFNYVHRSAEDRRGDVVGEAAYLGTAVHSTAQNVLAHGQDIDSAIEDGIRTYKEINKAQYACEEIVKQEKYCEVIPAMVRHLVDLLTEHKFTACEEEVQISCNLPGIYLDIIGYVDLVADGIFTEIKTRAPVKTRTLKDGSQGWGKGRLPKDEPEKAHVMQAALYAYALKMTPSITYVSPEEAKIYTPFNCESLKRANLKIALEDLRQRILIKQNLLRLSPDAKTLASITDPDWSHNFIWNIQPELLTEAKKLWQI